MFARIKAGSLFACPVMVPRPNTVLSWSFLSRYYDVDFLITKDEDDGRSKVLVPSLSFSHDVEHQGKIVVPEMGTYYLVWDNSSSWMRERIITYSYTLHFPEIDIDEKNLCSK